MTIGYCDPDGTTLAQWALADQNPHHLAINGGVRQPADPDWDDVAYIDGDENQYEQYTMSNLDIGGGTATSVIVWTSMATTVITHDPYVRLYCGGWLAEVVINLTQTGRKWYSQTYNGIFSQADINAMQVRYKAPGIISATEQGRNYETYCEVIYEVPSGYEHDYIGVPSANIGNVSGVPTDNIASIKGV